MSPITTLLVYEQEIDRIINALKSGVIRMAKDETRPYLPLRENKEILLDETGNYVMPHPRIGISLAGTIEKLNAIWPAKKSNHLFVINRNTILEDGFALNTKDHTHWLIIVTKKMRKEEYIIRVERMKRSWTYLGMYIKYG